jgi:outer membrane receptor protein involved in Fe transport
VTQSRDVREANFAERFDKSVCAGGLVRDPAFGGAEFQFVPICGGNPNLGPEVADTTVLGFVYEPGWAQGFNLSVDWYEISIADAIGSLDFQRIVDQCSVGVQSLCSQIVRDANGQVSTIYNTYVNVDEAKVAGIDLEATYRIEPDFFGSKNESLSLRVLGGYLEERSDTPLGGTPLDVAGSLETPDRTAVATLQYDVGRVGVQLQQRYVAPTIRDINWIEGVDVDDNTIPSGNYTNLRVGYSGSMATGADWTVALSVTNLFDRAPPIVPNSSYLGGAQTADTFFDTLGRRFELSLGMNF